MKKTIKLKKNGKIAMEEKASLLLHAVTCFVNMEMVTDGVVQKENEPWMISAYSDYNATKAE